MTPATMEPIYRCLYRLQVPPASKGFFQLAYALQLILEDPERLTAVTKCLYPEVAHHYHTTAAAVERNIRRMIDMIWSNEAAALVQAAGHPLTRRPSSSQALAILTAVLSVHTPSS